MSSNKAPQTIAVSSGIGDDSAFGAVTPPLYLSSNFTFEGFELARRYDYTRSGNPTRDLLAKTLLSWREAPALLSFPRAWPPSTFPSSVWNLETSSSPHMTVTLEHGAC